MADPSSTSSASTIPPSSSAPSASTSTTSDPPQVSRAIFDHGRNTKYWLRCLRTLLPTEYTSNDLNRTSLAFFCVNGLSILGELGNLTTQVERDHWISWLYLNQLPSGGFRGSPATDLGSASSASNAVWDPATLPGTFFCLITLAALGDDLSRVNRLGALRWLAKLQRSDGSFAEMLYPGVEEGEDTATRDPRFIYLAACVRWVLRGEEGSLGEDVGDIDVDQAVRYLQSCEAYDYGYGSRPGAESHAGHTFCTIAALSLLSRLQAPREQVSYPSGLPNASKTIHWLLSRQTALTDPDAFSSDSHISPPPPSFPPSDCFNGFNGRCNKRTDTCYSFWVIASLDLLKKAHLVNAESNRQFLLEQTAHRIGGFGKWPGSPPDVLHSCLGMVSLGIFREEGLNRVDSALCTALQTREWVEGLEWRRRK